MLMNWSYGKKTMNLINWKKVSSLHQELSKKANKPDELKIITKTDKNTTMAYVKFDQYQKFLWDIDQNNAIVFVAIYASRRGHLPIAIFERREGITNPQKSSVIKNYIGYSQIKKDVIARLLALSLESQLLIEGKYEAK